jgi:hypothetical protein
VVKCKEYGLYDIMGFRYNWNKEILAQFHGSFYFNEFSNTIYWTTQWQKYCIDYMTFSRLLALGSKDETCDAIHFKEKLMLMMSPSCSSILYYLMRERQIISNHTTCNTLRFGLIAKWEISKT